MAFQVLITDHAWPSLEIEQQVLASAGAQLIVAETGAESELVQLAPAADAILTNWKPVTPAVLDAARRCMLVSRYGIGLDNIAVEHATRLGILVTNVPDFCLEEVSDHAMALLLACARRVVQFARATRQGQWGLNPRPPLPRLRGQTLGLVGYGNIARALVPKALGLGLRIIAYTPHIAADALSPFGQATNDLDCLLRQSDYVSIHVPLTATTRSLIDARALRQMKPTAFLINTSRGAIIDEAALYQALTEGWIAGAGLDVLIQEPAKANPLLALENVIVTPHVAFYSEVAIAELEQKAAEHVAQVLRGEIPTNIVNPAVTQQPNYRLGAFRK
ncbi:MAG: C-terminal binding protein [Deinococcus sp.]|nr:C-terminal binding protein [Deinococcus sp.]